MRIASAMRINLLVDETKNDGNQGAEDVNDGSGVDRPSIIIYPGFSATRRYPHKWWDRRGQFPTYDTYPQC